MEKYILKYMMDSTQNAWRKRYYDYMKMRLDRFFWSNGNHLRDNLEYEQLKAENIIIARKGINKEILLRLRRMLAKKIPIRRSMKEPEDLLWSAKNMPYQYSVLSVFAQPYLTNDVVRGLNEIGIKVDTIYNANGEWVDDYLRLVAWFNKTSKMHFNELITDACINELKNLYESFQASLKQANYDAVLVHTAERFETKIFIDIFKKCGKCSIELTHGVPGADSKIDERVDYRLVYGEGIRKNCIALGYNSKQVLVAGNSKYMKQAIHKPMNLRCDYQDVLVMTSAPFAGHHHEWAFDQFPIFDRSLLITYLYNVEDILKSNHITHARLRPHPSVSKEWLARYIDLDFYEIDYLSLEESLQKATCCIGQNSTTVFEAILSGVTYMVYEPGDGKCSMAGNRLATPFDGADTRLKIANTEEQLCEMINSHYCPDVKILDDYLECFKPEVIRDILDKHNKKE